MSLHSLCPICWLYIMIGGELEYFYAYGDITLLIDQYLSALCVQPIVYISS